jgi:hypothetical protein
MEKTFAVLEQMVMTVLNEQFEKAGNSVRLEGRVPPA